MKTSLLATALSAAFVIAAPIAYAQTAESAADAPVVVAQAASPAAPSAGAPREARDSKQFRTPSERVEARLAFARTQLKITDAQQPQWDNFANVLRKHARAMDERFQQRRAQWEAARADNGGQSGDAARLQSAQPQRPSVTAIERLERSQQRLAERSARLNEVVAAAKPLYAALSPEQQQTADGMLARHGQHDHGKNHHRGMHRGA
jgi:protein CpxP